MRAGSGEVEISQPQRGDRRKLIDQARPQPRKRRPDGGIDHGQAAAGAGRGVRAARAAKRIEVYDNSHIMGTNATGAMIVAGPEGFGRTAIASSTSSRGSLRATISE